MDTVEVQWPNGKTETLHDVAADAIFSNVESEGIKENEPLPPVKDKSTENAAKEK